MNNNEMQVTTTANPFFEASEADYSVELVGRQKMFCSLRAETKEEKETLFNTMNSPDERISDHINNVIYVKDLYCETVNTVSRTTGETTQCPRVVLVDADGVGYQCVSFGIFNAIKKLISIYGVPTWNDPIPLEVRQITKGEMKILTLVSPKKSKKKEK